MDVVGQPCLCRTERREALRLAAQVGDARIDRRDPRRHTLQIQTTGLLERRLRDVDRAVDRLHVAVAIVQGQSHLLPLLQQVVPALVQIGDGAIVGDGVGADQLVEIGIGRISLLEASHQRQVHALLEQQVVLLVFQAVDARQNRLDLGADVGRLMLLLKVPERVLGAGQLVRLLIEAALDELAPPGRGESRLLARVIAIHPGDGIGGIARPNRVGAVDGDLDDVRLRQDACGGRGLKLVPYFVGGPHGQRDLLRPQRRRPRRDEHREPRTVEGRAVARRSVGVSTRGERVRVRRQLEAVGPLGCIGGHHRHVVPDQHAEEQVGRLRHLQRHSRCDRRPRRNQLAADHLLFRDERVDPVVVLRLSHRRALDRRLLLLADPNSDDRGIDALQPRHEIGGDALMHDQPPEAGAALPRRAHRGKGDGAQREIEIGRGADDRGVVAAELEDCAREALRETRRDVPAHRRRAGGRDELHLRMIDQRLPHRRAADHQR